MVINKIVELYKKNNMTQQSLADAIGMSKTNLNLILVGKQDFKSAAIEKLAELFKVKAGYFFEDYEEAKEIKTALHPNYNNENLNIVKTNQRIKDLEELIKAKTLIIDLLLEDRKK